MKTMTTQKWTRRSTRTVTSSASRTRGTAAPSTERPIEQFGPELIESAEYEYTSAVSMPGLLVAIDQIRPEASQPVRRAVSRPADELLATEDGDAVSICQLPGRIVSESPWTGRLVPARTDDEPDEMDEYSERAAMQWPGLLVVPEASAESPSPDKPRGLCADCLIRDECQFPKPVSGVWRCEEYR